MRIQSLKIENFKGIELFEAALDGESCRIHGFHGVGKTTVQDAWMWLVLDCDSKDNSNFAIKPRGTDGEEVHELETAVCATIINDKGKTWTLQKKYEEKYVKRRGEALKTFAGHTMGFYIDGVSVPKKKWSSELEKIFGCDGPTLKMLTMLQNFNALPWQDRRGILMSMVKDVTDEMVFSTHAEKLRDLSTALETAGTSIAGLESQAREKKARIGKEIEGIPYRIDELSKTYSGQVATSKEIEPEIANLKKRINDLQTKSGKTAKKKEKRALVEKLDEAKAAYEKRKREEVDLLEVAISKYRRSAAEEKENIVVLGKKIETLKAKIDSLRNEFREEQAVVYKGDEKCPVCGQKLPSDQVKKAAETFDKKKAKKLKAINKEGCGVTAQWKEAKLLIDQKESNLTDMLARIEKNEIILQKVKEQEPPKWRELTEKIQALTEEIETSGEEEVSAKIAELALELEDKQKIVAEKESYERAIKRISELKEKERSLAAEYEENERILNLAREFTILKSNMVSEKVSEMFKLAEFRLFKMLVDGSLRETCTTLYKGIPYGAGLNTGNEILVDADCVRTLQRFYGKNLPVWVDHAESCKYDIELDGQQLILLEVSKEPKIQIEKLRED